jgi:hypothetical protein
MFPEQYEFAYAPVTKDKVPFHVPTCEVSSPTHCGVSESDLSGGMLSVKTGLVFRLFLPIAPTPRGRLRSSVESDIEASTYSAASPPASTALHKTSTSTVGLIGVPKSISRGRGLEMGLAQRSACDAPTKVT